jgi:agmatinase
VFGVPFDATASYRPGSKFGPNALREALLNIEIYSTRLGLDLERESIEDLGNVRHTANVEEMTKAVAAVTRELLQAPCVPAVVGGEHTLTYATTRELPAETAIVVFDAHLDLRDEYDGFRLGHATFLRRLVEGRTAKNIVHVAARAASGDEWRFADATGLAMVSDAVLRTSDKRAQLVQGLLADVTQVYVSLDLDVLDPAYAPGVGNPEPAGFSTHELLELLHSLAGKQVVGFDVVELCPSYDNGASAAAAAKIFAELWALALQPAKTH